MQTFLFKLVKDVITTFVVTSTGLLATGQAFGKAEALAAAITGLKAALGVLVKDLGEPNSPHL